MDGTVRAWAPPTTAPWRHAAARLRVSDAERDNTVAVLRDHLIAGRLAVEEFEQRVEEAWSARFAAELWNALRGLPLPVPAAPAVATRALAASGYGALSLLAGATGMLMLFVSFGLLFALALPFCLCAWLWGRKARRARTAAGRPPAAAAGLGEGLGIAGFVVSLAMLAGCMAILA